MSENDSPKSAAAQSGTPEEFETIMHRLRKRALISALVFATGFLFLMAALLYKYFDTNATPKNKEIITQSLNLPANAEIRMISASEEELIFLVNEGEAEEILIFDRKTSSLVSRIKLSRQ